MRRHYSTAAWAREQYTDRWNDCPYFRDMVERGEIPADYIGRRTVMIHAPIKGTVLLTEGYHFTVDDEEGRQYGEIGIGLARGVNQNGLDCWYCVQVFLLDGCEVTWVDTPASK